METTQRTATTHLTAEEAQAVRNLADRLVNEARNDLDAAIRLGRRADQAKAQADYDSFVKIAEIAHRHLDQLRHEDDSLVPCPLGLHDPQHTDEDGYAPYDGCPDCDEIAQVNGLTLSELETAARAVHEHGASLDDAISEIAR